MFRINNNYLFSCCVLLISILCLNVYTLSAQNGRLFLVAGQSNAVGNSDDVTKSPLRVSESAYEYNVLTNDFQPLKDPMGQNFQQLQQGKGSIGPAFANAFYRLTGQQVFMISAARGGASNCSKAELAPYGTWDDNGNLLVFDAAALKVNLAIQKCGLPLSGIIWLQGERDANAILAGKETEAEYKQALLKLIGRFRERFGAKLPFYIVLTGLQTDVATTGSMTVRKVQCEIANTVPNVYVAYTSTHTFPSKGWLWDKVHYKQEGYNNIGDSVAQFISKIDIEVKK